eukprot:TRINITY_DN60482_c0_g3_i1.p1 TRINITY_DN60482_c0_g3~~TRINITY_DN60482_c0_g3_i1.p1  ORF type:complete len:703 (+),score=18.18 TRINITY_DN60482_c0_g3_i1:40-2148(+)
MAWQGECAACSAKGISSMLFRTRQYGPLDAHKVSPNDSMWSFTSSEYSSVTVGGGFPMGMARLCKNCKTAVCSGAGIIKGRIKWVDLNTPAVTMKPAATNKSSRTTVLYSCTMCDQSFATTHDRDTHELSHAVDCPFCARKFRPADIETHLQIYHRKELETPTGTLTRNDVPDDAMSRGPDMAQLEQHINSRLEAAESHKQQEESYTTRQDAGGTHLPVYTHELTDKFNLSSSPDISQSNPPLAKTVIANSNTTSSNVSTSPATVSTTHLYESSRNSWDTTTTEGSHSSATFTPGSRKDPSLNSKNPHNTALSTSHLDVSSSSTHANSQPAVSPRSRQECPYCHKGFWGSEEYEVHILTEHTAEFAADNLKYLPQPPPELPPDNFEFENVSPLRRDKLNSSSGFITGKPRGIQGENNSCYIDSLLFSLFALNDAFDDFISEDRPLRDRNAEQVRSRLRTSVVNPLRGRFYVEGVVLKEIRRMLGAKYLPGASSISGEWEERDVEELLSCLFRLLEVPPLLELSACGDLHERHCHLLPLQIGSEQSNQYSTDLSVQELLNRARVQFVREPKVLVIHLPREFKAATLTRDGAARPARPQSVFIQPSLNLELHVEREGQSPFRLVSAICIGMSHYVAYVRSADSTNKNWYFFDSMAERIDPWNIPEVKDVGELPELQGTRGDYKDEHARRLAHSLYMCVYIPGFD